MRGRATSWRIRNPLTTCLNRASLRIVSKTVVCPGARLEPTITRRSGCAKARSVQTAKATSPVRTPSPAGRLVCEAPLALAGRRDAKGVSSYQLGAMPQNTCRKKHTVSANGATHGPPPQRPARSSIPHVTLIEFDLILAQPLAILLLKGLCPMMFLLGVDVVYQTLQSAEFRRECSIASLPKERSINVPLLFDPG